MGIRCASASLKKMLIGIVVAMVYSLLMFPGGENRSTFLKPSFLCFKDGRVEVCGTHVHHWFVFLPLFFLFASLEGIPAMEDLAAFSGCMVCHGLAYKDRFKCRDAPEKPAVAVIDEIKDEEFEEEAMSEELIDTMI